MLKSKVAVAKVGDVIRSLDFPGVSDCYLIGRVTEVDGEIIKGRVISSVWEGEAEVNTGTFQTVQEGYMAFDTRYPGRITVL